MAVLAKFSATGLADGTVVSTSTAGTGDTPFSNVNGTAPTISATGVRSPRLKFDQQASNTSYLGWSSAVLGTGRTTFGVRIYAEFTAWTSSSFTILGAYNASGQAVGRIDLAGTSAGQPGQVRLKDDTTTFQTSNAVLLSLNTPYRFEFLYNAGALTANVYQGDAVTQTVGLTGTAVQTAPDRLRFGPTAATPTVPTFYMDDIQLVDSATESGPAGTAPKPQLSIWTGSEEVVIFTAA